MMIEVHEPRNRRGQKRRGIVRSMSRLLITIFAAAVLSCAARPSVPASPVAAVSSDASSEAVAQGNPRDDLIPREVLFGDPERTSVQISPDGKWLSWLAPSQGLLNVWVAPVDALDAVRPVTADTTDLVGYLSLPRETDPDGDGRPSAPLPTVLLVHGGPWDRDAWGYDSLHQFLASRGYAVLSVNFRGSTGFGKAFINAGDRQWGRKMHDDLLDGVAWAVAEKVALPDRIAIMGGSYGGYAALVGLAMTPDVFACGVDIVGPSSLTTFIDSIPPYWAPMIAFIHRRLGDPTTPEGRQALVDASPLTHASKISRPLLIAQGANDPRVAKAESDQIVEAMKAGDVPVSYVVFPDEGHGFANPANSIAFFAVAEAFLSVHLGGVYQPLDDAVLKASSMQIAAGARWLPGPSASP